jgi:alpha-amylase
LAEDAALERQTLVQGSAKQLELAAAEMAQAAAALVEVEQRIETEVASADIIPPALERARQEAAASLERKMATMEAVVTARRKHGTLADVPKPALETEEDKVKKQLQPPPHISTGPAAGDGYEIILQVCPLAWTHGHAVDTKCAVARLLWKVYVCVIHGLIACCLRTKLMAGQSELHVRGQGHSMSYCVTCTCSCTGLQLGELQRYLPRDLYQLNSAYGTENELRDCIKELKRWNLKVIADIVINHRCAHTQVRLDSY